MKNP